MAKASLMIISLKGTGRHTPTSHPGEETRNITRDDSGDRRVSLRAAGVPGTASGRKAQRRLRKTCKGQQRANSKSGGRRGPCGVVWLQHGECGGRVGAGAEEGG